MNPEVLDLIYSLSLSEDEHNQIFFEKLGEDYIIKGTVNEIVRDKILDLSGFNNLPEEERTKEFQRILEDVISRSIELFLNDIKKDVQDEQHSSEDQET